MTYRYLMLLSVCVLIALFTVLFAGEKKLATRTVVVFDQQSLANQHLKVQNMTLVEKLNLSPEYANLTAAQKVLVIVDQFKKQKNKVVVGINKVHLKKETISNRSIRFDVQ